MVRRLFDSYLAQDRASAEQRRVAPTGDDVFVMYQYELLDGTRHRNAELITVHDGKVVEVQVYFGAQVPPD